MTSPGQILWLPPAWSGERPGSLRSQLLWLTSICITLHGYGVSYCQAHIWPASPSALICVCELNQEVKMQKLLGKRGNWLQLENCLAGWGADFMWSNPHGFVLIHFVSPFMVHCRSIFCTHDLSIFLCRDMILRSQNCVPLTSHWPI